MNTAYFYLTDEGGYLVRRLAAVHPGDIFDKDNFKENLRAAFTRYDSLVCVMATGIVTRIIAPLLVHKTSDPAVVVMDQNGHYAISLLSGHLGGANDLAREMAAISGGEAVITTATDVADKLAFDNFAKANDMAIQNIDQLKYISSALLSNEKVQVFTNRVYPELEAAKEDGSLILLPLPGSKDADMSVSTSVSLHGRSVPAHDLPTVVIDEGFTFPEDASAPFPVLYLRPRTVFAGIGCKRDMEQPAIEEALLLTLEKEKIHPLSLKCIATIALKANEPGIIGTAGRLNVPLQIIDTKDIEALDLNRLGIASSEFVEKQTGVPSVSTACAYLASGCGQIFVDKEKYKGITIALAKALS